MKGEYFVHKIDDVVYSTDSPFWACFFTDKPMPGSERQSGPYIPEDWSVITHKGKIIYRVPKEVSHDKY